MKFNRILFSLLIISLFLCSQTSHTEAAESSATPSWQKTARNAGLSEEDISLLDKNRILITNGTYKQIFSAYIGGKEPSFITSDSFLNAYHVAYEESILRLEKSMAARLPFILKPILRNIHSTDDNITGKPMLVSSAKKRAILVIGIALRLMDDSFRLKNDELNSIIENEIKRIIKAEDILMPDWLGKSDDTFIAIDYSRFRPRGFYTQSDRLKRYFRAVSWLQAIPFRVSRDEELLAILMLGYSMSPGRFEDSSEREKTISFFEAYKTFIGPGDSLDLMDAADQTQNGINMDLNIDDIQKWRVRLIKEAEGDGIGSVINDQIRFAPDDPTRVAEPEFRIISAYRTPDAVLFQQTTDPRKFKRPYPDGLEVLTALGSGFARGALKDDQREDILKTIESCKTYFTGKSLYIKYLDTLKTLVDEPDPDVPDFMKTNAWKIKSANTALSGWAQLRHTWMLQAKSINHALSAPGGPDGFVEPEPEFFSKMSELISDTYSSLKQAGAFDPDPYNIIEYIERLREVLEGVSSPEELQKNISRLDGTGGLTPYRLMDMTKTKAKKGSAAYYNEQRQWIDTLIVDLKNDKIDKYPWLKRDFGFFEEWDVLDFKELWATLKFTVQRLETISNKQLKHIDLNEDENEFFGMYGVLIAMIMKYSPPASLRPKDDAMRVADVYANLANGGYLHAGIARPRKLYVLYPWEGQTILCTGAVLPYYEFINSSRLDDESWKEMLDSDKRPSIPEWITPIVSEGHLGKSKYNNP